MTIPATVELGSTVTVTAEGVILPTDKQLKVAVSTTDNKFEVAQVDKNNTVVDRCEYTVTNKGDTPNNLNGTPVTPGATVLTAENGKNKTVFLQFNAPATTYSGEYKGTVNFTVSVDNAS